MKEKLLREYGRLINYDVQDANESARYIVFGRMAWVTICF